jgi:acyl-CoA thioesterase
MRAGHWLRADPSQNQRSASAFSSHPKGTNYEQYEHRKPVFINRTHPQEALMTTNHQAIEAYIQKDPFARHLGARVEIPAPGHSRVTLTVGEEMVNFHGLTHGGVIFALGDMAFAAAANSFGQTAVALNVAINYLKASRAGDRLVAEARLCHEGGPTALYTVTIRDARTGELVARSEDLAYRKKSWFASPETMGEIG